MRFLTLVLVLAAPAALAFPWMVKHNYGSCAACHVDPSGAGQLTAYGRAQADVLLRWKVEQPDPEVEQEVPPSANFLWFLALPEAVNLSGNLRGGALVRPASEPLAVPLIMAADLYATFNVDRFVFHGSAGFGIRSRAAKAIVFPSCDPTLGECGASLVAREFWAGAKFADDTVMVRAGRLTLPFGLRNNEHTSLVREYTVTDVNADQQVGLAVAYNTELLRGEVMGIAGNFQLGPDSWRERGYSAFAEYALAPTAYVGLSSLITQTQAGFATTRPTTRHAHGVFARVAPVPSLALLAEVDFLATSSLPDPDRFGFAAWLQADWEPVRGFHLMASGEAGTRGGTLPRVLYGAWLSAAWYPLPHVEVRLDNVLRVQGAAWDYSLLAMLHLFL